MGFWPIFLFSCYNLNMGKNNQNLDFLQSDAWRNFQEKTGRKVYFIENKDASSASIVEHELPIVGRYLYCPRGPILKVESVASGLSSGQKLKVKNFIAELIELAKKENEGWIRIEPENNEILKLIKENTDCKIVKASHDVQPKEVFVLDISKSAEQLLTEMKPKTRYNIGVAKKKGIIVVESQKLKAESSKYIEEFLKLTKEMADRHGINAHPEQYYRKMIESLPEEMLKIYVAKFEGEIIAVNLVLFFGDTATYLHGASGNVHRNLMAPFLLQWQAILDAKEKGYTKYDFGGINTATKENAWSGITTFKMGFSPRTKSVEFPGTYDIIVNPRMYAVYKGLQRAKSLVHIFKR